MPTDSFAPHFIDTMTVPVEIVAIRPSLEIRGKWIEKKSQKKEFLDTVVAKPNPSFVSVPVRDIVRTVLCSTAFDSFSSVDFRVSHALSTFDTEQCNCS